MVQLNIRLFQTFEVIVAGQPVVGFRSAKVQALLAYLVVEADRPRRRETLAGLLWPDQTEQAARRNLSQVLFHLRKAIGDSEAEPPFLLTTPQTIQFNPGGDAWVDVTAFSDHLAACQTHQHPDLAGCSSCMQELQQAADLYQGRFLAGFSVSDSDLFEEWALLEQERLHRQALEVFEVLTDCHQQQGAYKSALNYARRQTDLDPLHEDAQRRVMHLLALSGQRSAALAQYAHCEHILAEELGVEPAAETKALYEQIQAGTFEGGTGSEARSGELSFSQTRSRPVAPRHNLPLQTASLLGREAELAELTGLLTESDARLITILGPGGIGKSHLALEAAAAQLDHFTHGVYFVRLARLDAPEGIIAAVAGALRYTFHERRQQRAQLLDYLREKHILLVMDNFEHLLAGAEFITEMLAVAPGLKILATSRARLNLQNEQLFSLTGIDFPAGETTEGLTPAGRPEPTDSARYSAVKLFLRAARQVDPYFELSPDNLADVARICRLVEGLPLAILLAAAWIDMLSPAEISAEIRRSLDFLETDLQDVPERQQSLRALFEHSWRLLAESERAVFQQLSIFRGGFDRQAAQVVTGASLRLLRALMNKSFLYRRPDGRYEVHEVLRQYAAEKLAQSPNANQATHDRFAAYYATVLQRREADLNSSRQQWAIEAIEADSENVRTAWNWSASQGQLKQLEQALFSLGSFYQWRGRYQEGEAIFQMAARKLDELEPQTPAQTGDQKRVLVKVLTWQSLFSSFSERQTLAGELLKRSLTLLESPELSGQDLRAEQALVLRRMGVLVDSTDREEAARLYQQSLDLYTALDDRRGMATALHRLGRIAFRARNYNKARERYQQSLDIRTALGDQRGMAASLKGLGTIALLEFRPRKAEYLLRDSLKHYQAIGYQLGIVDGFQDLTSTFSALGKIEESHALLEECRALCIEAGLRFELAFTDAIQSFMKAHLGQYEGAYTQASRSLELGRELGHQRAIAMALLVMGGTKMIVGQLDEAQPLLQESIDVYQAIRKWDQLCWAMAAMGQLYRDLGDRALAEKYLIKGFRMAVETQSFLGLATIVPTMTLLLIDRGKLELAIEIYALALTNPLMANSHFPEDSLQPHLDAATATLLPDVIAAAEARGRERDPLMTVMELMGEFSD